jgi:hypothetical protein
MLKFVLKYTKFRQNLQKSYPIALVHSWYEYFSVFPKFFSQLIRYFLILVLMTPSHLFSYLITYLLTYLLTYSLTHSLTHSLHGAEDII